MTTFTGTIPTIASGDTTTVPTNLATYRDALKALSEAWTSYTPVLTASTSNPTLGNSTIVGHYRQVNKDVAFWIKLTIGSTFSVGSGIYQLTLPVAPFATHPCHFDVFVFDASTSANYRGVTGGVSGSRVNLLYDNSGASGLLAAFTNAVPVVPGTGDTYEVQGHYEAA